MTPFEAELFRRLEAMQETMSRMEQRIRALALVQMQARKDELARARAPVPPPAAEPPPAPAGTVVRLLDGGWPGVARLAILASPFFAALLLWLSWATGTPLPSLILALFGAVPHADPSSGP